MVWSPEARAAQAERSRGNTARKGRGLVAPVFVRDGIPGKVCVKCLDWKPLEKFARHASSAGGRRNTCTTCEGRIAYKQNPARSIKHVRAYQKRHPDKYREHHRAGQERRHGRIAAGPGVSVQDYRDLKQMYGDVCAYCGDPATTFDHVRPLSRGGLHEVDNLVPACKPCNFEKHNKTLAEWIPPRRRS